MRRHRQAASAVAAAITGFSQIGYARPLSSGKRDFKADLARAFGISRETVYSYLRAVPASG